MSIFAIPCTNLVNTPENRIIGCNNDSGLSQALTADEVKTLLDLSSVASGASSSLNNYVALFDGTTGKALKSQSVMSVDSGIVYIAGSGELIVRSTAPNARYASLSNNGSNSVLSTSFGNVIIRYPSSNGAYFYDSNSSLSTIIDNTNGIRIFNGGRLRAYHTNNSNYCEVSHNGTNGIITSSLGNVVATPETPYAFVISTNRLGLTTTGSDGSNVFTIYSNNFSQMLQLNAVGTLKLTASEESARTSSISPMVSGIGLQINNNTINSYRDLHLRELRSYNTSGNYLSLKTNGPSGIIDGTYDSLTIVGGEQISSKITLKPVSTQSFNLSVDYQNSRAYLDGGYFQTSSSNGLVINGGTYYSRDRLFFNERVAISDVTTGGTGIIQVNNGTNGNYRRIDAGDHRFYGSGNVNYGFLTNDNTDSIIGTSTNRVRIRTKSNFDFTFSDDTVTPVFTVPNNGYLITNKISGQSSQGSLTRLSSPGAWKITGNLDSGGGVWTSPPTTPSSGITASINNYNPGLGWYFRIQSSGTVDITGLSISQTDGQPAELWNVGDNDIILKYQDTNSTAANRFICIPSGDITLGKDDIAMLRYDGTTQRWRISKA